MKTRFLSLFLLCFGIAMSTSCAGVVYSGIINVPIPLDFEGVYLRMPSGLTTTAAPGDWSTAPWLNPFFGGVGIASSPLLRPVITGTDQILNLAPGTPINSSSNFALGESGSSTHVGNGAGQFALGVPGYMAFAFRTTPTGPDYYGWVFMRINNDGPGSIIAWAYESVAGAQIPVDGIVGTPEPAGVLTGLLCIGLATLRRRR